MKRSRQAVPNAITGAVATDQGYAPNTNLQGITMREKGGRNATTNESRRAAGQLAPRPQNSKAPLLGSSAHTGPTTASMARVRESGKSPAEGRFLPVQNNAMANLAGSTIGQPDPHGFNPGGPGINMGRPATRTGVTNHPVATAKPKRKGLGAAFYGEF